MARVIWTRRAIGNLEAIRSYIGQLSPLAAQRMALRLKSAGESLKDQPMRGRSAGARRELTTIPPYLIRYRIDGEQVTILEVRHGARQPD